MNAMNKVTTAAEAVSLVQSGQTIAVAGVIGWLTPDHVLQSLAARFEDNATPRDLTFFFPVSTGDGLEIQGMDHIAREGLIKRVISGNYINTLNPTTGRRPEMMRLIRENLIEAYCWPIGATMHWLREVARRSPGYITKIGIGSYIDPRLQGGKYTQRAKDDLVRILEIDKEEYLFYPTASINVGIIRATAADEYGNLSFEDEPLTSSALAIALAVKACGGKVIAQVRKIVPRMSRQVHSVRIPGDLVDRVVVAPDQMMTTGVRFDDAFLGGKIYDGEPFGGSSLSADKIIASRAAVDIRPGPVTIFGFGASSDIPGVMAEQGRFKENGILNYRFTTEHGPFGGLVMGGWEFSANRYPEALIDGPSQFDFIDGGNCKVAALAFAELDELCNINVSRFGSANPGPGGFIDIAHSAKELLFTGTFTTGGLRTQVVDGRLNILEEGRVRKFVKRVNEVTYPLGVNVRNRAQKATVYTERAVFRVENEGLVLIEVAPGIDVKTQVLDLMDFKPTHVLDPLPLMDSNHFRP